MEWKGKSQHGERVSRRHAGVASRCILLSLSARSPRSAIFRHPPHPRSTAHHTPVEEAHRRMTLNVPIPAPSNYRTSTHLPLDE